MRLCIIILSVASAGLAGATLNGVTNDVFAFYANESDCNAGVNVTSYDFKEIIPACRFIQGKNDYNYKMSTANNTHYTMKYYWDSNCTNSSKSQKSWTYACTYSDDGWRAKVNVTDPFVYFQEEFSDDNCTNSTDQAYHGHLLGCQVDNGESDEWDTSSGTSLVLKKYKNPDCSGTPNSTKTLALGTDQCSAQEDEDDKYVQRLVKGGNTTSPGDSSDDPDDPNSPSDTEDSSEDNAGTRRHMTLLSAVASFLASYSTA